jgi:hypothetical protein
MEIIKNSIGIIAVALTFFGYIPYIRDTIKGKTKPHVYTWFIWALVSFIAFMLQMSDHAGLGSLVTLSAAIVCFIIFLFGMRIGDKDITRIDTVFLILSFGALGLWLFAKQPVISVILVSSIDILSFIPTIRKSWNKPYSETLSSYLMNTFRFTLGLLALQHYSLITTLYPITWLLGNGLFSIFLIVRRKMIS